MPNAEHDEPTLWRVMRRPVWVLALLLALAVAGGFAWLGKWQLGHAIQEEAQETELSETPRPLAELTAPWTPVSDVAAGMVSRAEGALEPDDFLLVEERLNAGEMGVWVVGNLRVSGDAGPAQLAVAIGWAPDRERAARAITHFEEQDVAVETQVTGRYMPPDGAAVPAPDADPERLETMAPAQLVNRWQHVTHPAYAGYLVVHPDESGFPLDRAELAAAGLDPIDSVPPLPVETVNWLNLFYAVEWVVFAGFAVFLWYRLARDAWEKELQLRELTAGTENP